MQRQSKKGTRLRLREPRGGESVASQPVRVRKTPESNVPEQKDTDQRGDKDLHPHPPGYLKKTHPSKAA